MISSIITPCFTDMDLSIPDWVSSGNAENFLIEVGKEKGVSVTAEQAEDWWCEHMCDFNSVMYEATVKVMEDAVEEIAEEETDDEKS